MSTEAQARLVQLQADFLESSEELGIAWTAVADQFSEEPAIQRLGAALTRYVAIQTDLKTLAMAALQKEHQL